jgi:acyl dehydratase
MVTRYFEDLDVGATFWGDTVTVEREEMLAFAERFDPQPMHLDDAAARAIGLDGVIAPGSFSFALRNLSLQGIVRDQIALLPGGLGIELSFVAPVYPGDRLRLRAEVADLRASSRAERGFARMSERFVNQDEVAVIELEVTWVIPTRG